MATVNILLKTFQYVLNGVLILGARSAFHAEVTALDEATGYLVELNYLTVQNGDGGLNMSVLAAIIDSKRGDSRQK